MVKIGADFTEVIPKIKLGIRFWTILYMPGKYRCVWNFSSRYTPSANK